MSILMRAVVAAACAWAVAGPGLAAPGYHLESSVKLPGAAPAWDYLTVDPARHFLFIGRRGAGVTVYDTVRRKAVARIANSAGADVARLAPRFDRGYTANEDGSTTVFQLSTLRTLARVKLG